jgi:XTP/dITP diphosphohydrolase
VRLSRDAMSGQPSPEAEPPREADRSPLVELVATFARLRRECGWKAAQTHSSLARFLLEEAYETVEAIEDGDPAHLREELGDLLLQVYLHAAIAAEAGEYDVEDVAADLQAKMVRRNPHVFAADGPAETDPERIDDLWHAVKATEKQRSEVMDGVPLALPALLRASKALDRLERAGRPAELDASSTDLGDRLLALVAEARAAKVDPEQALRAAVRRITD